MNSALCERNSQMCTYRHIRNFGRTIRWPLRATIIAWNFCQKWTNAIMCAVILLCNQYRTIMSWAFGCCIVPAGLKCQIQRVFLILLWMYIVAATNIEMDQSLLSTGMFNFKTTQPVLPRLPIDYTNVLTQCFFISLVLSLDLVAPNRLPSA